MPRHPRIDLAGVPQHILQIAGSGHVIFRSSADYRRYLDELSVCSRQQACAIHAYALLPADVQLLVTGKTAGAVSRMMQALGRRYAAYANTRDGGHGALWSGRFRSCLIGGGDRVLTSYRCIERSPIRERLASRVDAYRWSSHACNAQGREDALVTPHRQYLALGRDPGACQARYRALSAQALPDDIEASLLMHVRQGCPWGDARFLAKLARIFGYCPVARPRGRPKKAKTMNLVAAAATLSPFLLTGWSGAVQTLGA